MALFVAATLLIPFLAVLAFVFDAFRLATGHRRFVALRLTVIGWVYLAAEVVGIAALGALWVLSAGGRARGFFISGTYAIQRWWAGTLFSVIRTLFGLRVEVEGADEVSPGPIIVFMRHASIIDNLLPSALITAAHGIKLRYVLKKELLADPALDVAGSRLPNYFVDRTVGGTTEVAAIKNLGMGLAADEGVLIYPEGTRFTPERRERALARLEEKDPELLNRARALTSVLPPRTGRTARIARRRTGRRRRDRRPCRSRRVQSHSEHPRRRPGGRNGSSPVSEIPRLHHPDRLGRQDRVAVRPVGRGR